METGHGEMLGFTLAAGGQIINFEKDEKKCKNKRKSLSESLLLCRLLEMWQV